MESKFEIVDSKLSPISESSDAVVTFFPSYVSVRLPIPLRLYNFLKSSNCGKVLTTTEFMLYWKNFADFFERCKAENIKMTITNF